jgi:Flp pilus assembly secretin CpaC
MYKNKLTSLHICLICLALTSCEAGNPERQDNAAQLQARTQMLAENDQTIARAKSSVFPTGKKKLLEPDMLAVQAIPCDGNFFALNELTVRNFGLSNRDVFSAVMLLETMGYTTISHSSVVAGADGGFLPSGGVGGYSCDDLPLVLVPRPHEESNLILGDNRTASQGNNQGGSAQTGVGNLAISPLRRANAVDLDQLIVFYHESQTVKIERFEALLDSIIDTASPQVYIETMVLEVSEEDSKELGVAYQTANIGSNSLLQLGSLGIGDGPTVDYERNTRQDEDGNFAFSPGIGIQAQVKALVESGKAEILARPSVLALSNRQAVIQIVDVIQSPLVESSIGTTGELVVSAYSFEPLLLGITLNLRPRVSADRQWVSLEIDATVEAEVDENSGEVFAPDGEGGSILLAEKKGSAARKVKTFARIPDRTPIIIGGLVAGTNEKQKARVPVLGSIPFIGALFGATDTEVQKREIVIVLTPHVLAEDAIGVRANMASDAVMSRQSDLSLFNNVYRVSENDVFDMNFLLEDKRFAAYRSKANELLEQSPELIDNQTVRVFQDNRIPGDDVLVRKMIFDVVASNLARTFPDLNQLFLPLDEPDGSSRLVSLAEVTRELNEEEGNEVLQIQWSHDAEGKSRFRSNMVPVSSARAVPGQNAIILRSERDLQRLTAAIATDIVIDRNGGYSALNVSTVKDGMLLSMADVDDYTGFLFTDETAKIYFDSRHALRSLRVELDKAYLQIDSLQSLGAQSIMDRPPKEQEIL